MILMIDNYDSFTYNLVQYLGELGEEVEVHRNDKISIEDIKKLNPERIVISPGPCTPDKAGISMETVRRFAGQVPILGVCLGHQSLVQAKGGTIIKARKLMHGKTSMIHHDGKTIFKNLDNPFEATRYHSLIIDSNTLPDCFEITAWIDKDKNEIMGVRHKDLFLEGVQFHPESILTKCGKELLKNFLELPLTRKS